MSSWHPTAIHCPAMPNFSIMQASDDGSDLSFAQSKPPFNIYEDLESDDESEGGFEMPTNNDKVAIELVDTSMPVVQEPASVAISSQARIPSRPSTPTTDELVQYASDIGLFAVNPDLSQEPLLPTPNQEKEDLARLRAAITRWPAAGIVSRDIEFSTGTTRVQDFASQLPHPGITTVVQDFASQLPHPNVTIARGPLAGLGLRIENFPEWVISPVVDQEPFPSLVPPQDHTNGSPPASMPATPLIAGLSSPNMSDLALYADEIDLFDGPRPDWAVSPELQQEIFQPLGNVREQSSDAVILPPTPILGNLSSPNLSRASMLFDNTEPMSKPLPIRPKQSLRRQNEIETLSTVDKASPASSRGSIVPRFITPTKAKSEGQQPQLSHLAPGILPSIQQGFDMWAEIAHALNIPTYSSHPLTGNVLTKLLIEENIKELAAGYTKREPDQWALFQSRILEWINSGALKNDIDGVVDGRSFIVSLPSVLEDDDEGESWFYESVESYWRNELERFKRTIDWIQEAEGSVGSCHTLCSSVYDFCHDDDQIIHRSVSAPADSSESLSSDEDGEALMDPSSRLDSRSQMVLDSFRARELGRLEVNQSPIISCVKPQVFKNDGGPGERARTTALSLMERIADTTRRQGEALRSEVFPVVPADQPITLEDVLAGYNEPVTLPAFLRQELNERNGETLQIQTENNAAGSSPFTGGNSGDLSPLAEACPSNKLADVEALVTAVD